MRQGMRQAVYSGIAAICMGATQGCNVGVENFAPRFVSGYPSVQATSPQEGASGAGQNTSREVYRAPNGDVFVDNRVNMSYNQEIVFPTNTGGIRYNFENLEAARNFDILVGQASLNGRLNTQDWGALLRCFQTVDSPDTDHPNGDLIITEEETNHARFNPEFIIPRSGRIQGLLREENSSSGGNSDQATRNQPYHDRNSPGRR